MKKLILLILTAFLLNSCRRMPNEPADVEHPKRNELGYMAFDMNGETIRPLSIYYGFAGSNTSHELSFFYIEELDSTIIYIEFKNKERDVSFSISFIKSGLIDINDTLFVENLYPSGHGYIEIGNVSMYYTNIIPEKSWINILEKLDHSDREEERYEDYSWYIKAEFHFEATNESSDTIKIENGYFYGANRIPYCDCYYD